MSKWTHVCGNIRINAVRHSNSELEIEEHLNTFKSILEKKPKIPEGSEGALKYDFWIEPDGDALASYNIAIFGDLRDYTDVDYIKHWFKNVLNSLWIRGAVLIVTQEDSKYIFTPTKEFYPENENVELKEYIQKL